MTHFADPALLAALMLLAAIVGGYAAAFVRVPRVVGYLLAGLLLHLALAALAQRGETTAEWFQPLAQSARWLQGLKQLALGLIMFAIGSVFETSHMRAVGLRVLRLSAVKILTVVVLVGLGCTAIYTLRPGVSLTEALVLGGMLAVAGIATAPAATLLVLQEYGSKGTVSDTILTLTAINNTVCIIAFHTLFLVLAATGTIAGSYAEGRWLGLDLVLNSAGSMLLGVGLGFSFSVLYARVPMKDFSLIFLGVVLGLGAFRDLLSDELGISYNFLLTCLFLGATFANITVDTEPFQKALRSFSAPIFALFFVIAGYELHLDDLKHIGLIGAAYTVLRIGGKALGGWLGTRRRSGTHETPGYIGLGMLCQAGVAIGLADFLVRAWGTRTAEGFQPNPAAADFKTIILGSVVIFELVGPLALKAVAIRSGEVKAVTLLRRRPAGDAARESATRRSWQALLRTVGVTRPAGKSSETLRVRHIMRSSVKVLPASARFDEVLHFVESSRYNHFPVVDEHERYVGLIHFSDLRGMMYDPFVRELVTAHDLARQNTPLATPDMSLDELFTIFAESDVGSLAVIDDVESRHVVGIVEQRDLLAAMHQPRST